MKNKDITVIFNRNGLTLDTQEISGKAYFNETFLADFKSAPYRALFYFGFEDRHPDICQLLFHFYMICA